MRTDEIFEIFMKLTCPVCRSQTEINHIPNECSSCGTTLSSYSKLYLYPSLLFNSGLSAAREGDAAKASECFSAVVRWCPNDLEARNALAAVYLQLNKYDESRRCWEKVLEKRPNDPISKQGIAALDKLEKLPDKRVKSNRKKKKGQYRKKKKK